MDKIRVAAVQMVSGVSPETNVAAMKRLVARAAEQGADWVLLPEYWVLMGANVPANSHLPSLWAADAFRRH